MGLRRIVLASLVLIAVVTASGSAMAGFKMDAEGWGLYHRKATASSPGYNITPVGCQFDQPPSYVTNKGCGSAQTAMCLGTVTCNLMMETTQYDAQTGSDTRGSGSQSYDLGEVHFPVVCGANHCTNTNYDSTGGKQAWMFTGNECALDKNVSLDSELPKWASEGDKKLNESNASKAK